MASKQNRPLWSELVNRKSKDPIVVFVRLEHPEKYDEWRKWNKNKRPADHLGNVTKVGKPFTTVAPIPKR
jgi:hypothetical protein